MNLHNIAGPIVASVNPYIAGQYSQSTGSTTEADGSRTPSYATSQAVSIQKQPMTFGDLQQVNGLNLNGEKCAMYISGNWDGVARADQRGGDLISLPDASVWMVVQLLENWYDTAGWIKAAVVKQNGS